MSKIIRVRTAGYRHFQNGQRFPLDSIDAQVSVSIRSSAEFILYADYDGFSVPLYVGYYLDQTYHFEDNIQSLQVVLPEASPYSIRILQAGTRYKDMTDPVPYKAIAPLDSLSDTMENRILRSVDAALAARGLSAGKPKGRSYAESDEEFGTGYEYDEDEADEIDAAAVRAVAKKFAPPSADPPGVQPTGNDDKNKSARGKLGTKQPDSDTDEPGNNDAPD